VLAEMEKSIDTPSESNASALRPEVGSSKKPATRYASKWKQRNGAGNQPGKP
jgi:hypothetical protein